MEEIYEFKAELLKSVDDTTQRIIISNAISKDEKFKKHEISRIILRGARGFQISSYTEKQVFQNNVDKAMICGRILEMFPVKYSQINIFNTECEISYKLTKKESC